MKSKPTNSLISNSWHTTFGDLLTLLLCFFVCIISMTPLAETGTDKTASNKQDLNAGTGLAGDIGEGSEVELLLTEADYSDTEPVQLAKVQSMARTQLESENNSIHEAMVETCFNGIEMYEGESWYQSIERSLALRRQLIDAGVADNVVTIRSVGPWCETLKENRNRRQFVSRVVLKIG